MAGLQEEKVEVFDLIACNVCNAKEGRMETVEEVFRVDGRYVLVGGVPSTVCQRCGERSFTRDTTEKVRLMVHGRAAATKSVPMQVYEFAQ